MQQFGFTQCRFTNNGITVSKNYGQQGILSRSVQYTLFIF